jgi:hypothetical protein
MRHFQVIGETGRMIGEIWANDDITANAIADLVYASRPHSLKAAFTLEETHAA